MADKELKAESMRTFDGHEKIGTFKAAEKLTEFGEKQNEANELFAENISELLQRVAALEEQQAKNTEIMKRIAGELSAFKKELDRVRLSEKLNSSAVERLSNAITLADEGKNEPEIT